MMSESIRESLYKQGYRFVGRHSAIKICEWCKTSLRSKGACYKQKFYGISSHRCVQMTPAFFCTHNCEFCWRTMRFSSDIPEGFKWDEPEFIIDGCVAEQQKILKGFLGSRMTDKAKIHEAMRPNQFAISLAGEPCLYPKLPEMISIIRKREATSFLVTNGTVPEMIAKLKKNQPYQLYVTLPAPTEKIYKDICNPMLEDGWTRLMKSLRMMKKFGRSVVRLTLVKDMNMAEPEEYAKIIEEAEPTYVETKAFMSIGGARERLGIDKMPTHDEIKKFAKAIEENSSYKITDEKNDSRVVMLRRK